MQTVPIDILSYIFTYCNSSTAKDLATVSKQFHTVVNHVFCGLNQARSKTTAFETYLNIKEVKEAETETIRCRMLFKIIMRDAYKLGVVLTQEAFEARSKYNLIYECPYLVANDPTQINILTSLCLNKIAHLVKEQEAKNLIEFSIFAFKDTPSFPSQFVSLQDSHVIEQAELIRTWMQSKSFLLQSIDKLEFNNAKSTAIASEIKFFTNLSTLHIETAPNILNLPQEIWSLKNLTKLKIAETPIQSIAKEIAQLRALKTCQITNTLISSLPVEIGSLPLLESLLLGYNQNLATLPETIGSLDKLLFLSVNSCDQLSSLPEAFQNLRNLKTLLVDNKNTELYQSALKIKQHLPIAWLKKI